MKAGKGDYIGAYLHVHDSNHLPAKAADYVKFISHVRRWKMPTMLQISEMYNIG